MKKRFTVDIDRRVYLLDGELFEDWDDPADVCDELNSLLDKLESKPLDLHSDFQEYDELINKMNKDARELFRLEKEYQNEFNRVLEEAIEHKVDFKALYGGNNATTRKQYVEEQLSDMLDEIQELKFCKTENQRQLDFLKRLIDMKIQLIRYEVK